MDVLTGKDVLVALAFETVARIGRTAQYVPASPASAVIVDFGTPYQQRARSFRYDFVWRVPADGGSEWIIGVGQPGPQDHQVLGHFRASLLCCKLPSEEVRRVEQAGFGRVLWEWLRFRGHSLHLCPYVIVKSGALVANWQNADIPFAGVPAPGIRLEDPYDLRAEQAEIPFNRPLVEYAPDSITLCATPLVERIEAGACTPAR